MKVQIALRKLAPTPPTNLSLMRAAMALAAGGSPCVRKVWRGPLGDPSTSEYFFNQRAQEAPILSRRRHWNSLTQNANFLFTIEDAAAKRTRSLITDKHKRGVGIEANEWHGARRARPSSFRKH